MKFGLLGPVEVSEGGRARPLGGPKQRTVLVHLLLRANQIVASDRLIDELWGEEPPPAARSTLQVYVSHLRKVVGPERLEGRAGGYVLHVDPAAIDALRFDALVGEARALLGADPAAAARAFGEALALWRGPALDDLADQSSLRAEIARLEELRMAATEERIGAELELGRHAELVPELETLVGPHPLRERLWGHLMVALYRSGRQGEALAAYHRARELLADELGIDPSPELRRFEEQILRQDPALEIAGEPLRGYRLLEQVGAGAFGAVHRAFQPQVGREVAVKIIHPRLANDPEFIRRFEAEAQLVARLEHPHIVPLYDFWREPEGTYLVMRYLRGGSLREALAEGSMPTATSARLLDQVALALAAAHRQGVVHRDVKPANILFDEEQNAYLSDFGIATELAAAEATAAGATPSPLAYYLSPEEIRGEPATPATDVYSLGLVLYEALAGRHPFAETPPEQVLEKQLREPVPSIAAFRPDLPPGVQEVIERATAKDAAARYPDAPALAAALRGALAPAARPLAVPAAEVRNPYKGLRPFAEADAPDFFGREALVAELVARLAEHGEQARFLAVVGPSGSGKSSLVRAGLVPALRGGALSSSERWFAVDMHPGAHPFEELAGSLTRIAVDPPADLLERLEADDAGLRRAAEQLLPAAGSELLLVIDQFEELFTLVGDEEVRTRFLQALVAAATNPESQLRIVVTLRADFYDRPLSYPGLAELMKARTVTVTPLVPEELERAVAGPAQRVGVAVEPPLVADIVAEVATQPGALPLLQYALTEVFEHRTDSTLTVDAYRHIGGVAGALARRAEDLYGRLNQPGKEAARQLFLRLVTLGKEGGEDTRRRVLRAELTSIELDAEAMEAAIDTFGARRLLSFDRDPATRGPTVEVAHEALLREWGRLRGWIEAAREDVGAHRRLAAAAADWAEASRDPSFLLRGDRLSRLEAWAETSALALTTDERDYLQAGLNAREAEQEEEEERQAREATLERRSLVRARALVAVFAVLALVASALTTFAFNRQGSAQREARIATARELAAAAVANLDVHPERSILLALEAVDATRAADGFVVREAEEALHRAVKGSRVLRTVPHGGWGLGVTSDGTRFATGGSEDTDSTATVWDTETGEEVRVLTGPDVGRLALAYSPDDRLIATTHNDGTAWLWDADTGEELHVLEGHEGFLGHPAFSPDGRWLATGGEDATARVWDVATGTEEMVLTGHDEYINSTAFSPDGTRVATASDDATVRIWDLATGETAVALTGHAWQVFGVAFSPDGERIATASNDASARIWDAESGAHLLTLSGARSALNAIDFSPDGARVAGGSEDGTATVWDAESGRELLTLAGHATGIGNVAYTPDGERLLTTSLDGTTRLWDVGVAGGRDWLTVPGPNLRFTGVVFSPDGKHFAVPGDRAGVTIWDAETGEEVIALEGHNATIHGMAFSPDGSKLAGAAGTGATVRAANETVPVWDVDTGELVTLTGHREEVYRVAFSADGGRLATGSYDGTVKLWDAASGEELHMLESDVPVWVPAFSPDGRSLATIAGEGGVNGVKLWDAVTGAELDTLELGKDLGHLDFSPDGRFLVAAAADGSVTVWDTDTLEMRSLRGHTGEVNGGIAFGPNGQLVTASADGTARIWDMESGEELVTLRGHRGPVIDVAVSPDGTRVATGSEDGTAKLWDPATGRELLTFFGHDFLVDTVAFSPDGRLLATGSPDGTVALHLLPIDEFVAMARERVTRGFTDEECRQYLRLNTCPAAN